jgi:hypothetical protein
MGGSGQVPFAGISSRALNRETVLAVAVEGCDVRTGSVAL